MARLENRLALVTGAGGGLGAAISQAFAREGAAVVCQDLNEAAAERTADAVRESGSTAMTWACDVSDPVRIKEMFDEVRKDLGVVDILVNNAGVNKLPDDGRESARPLVDMSDEAWQRMLAIHLNGAFYCTRATVEGLLDAGTPGSLIFMSSIGGVSGMGGLHYSAAKGGLLGFMRSVARNVGRFGIRANAIAPGPIETPMIDGLGAALDALVATAPLGRVGRPEEVAATALFLASDDSSYFTGQCLSPNGGLVIY